MCSDNVLKKNEGVVINTFHGVKGEEYTTVIAFGILNGYIPHWDTIINKPIDYQKIEQKSYYMLFVHEQRRIYFFFQNKVVLRKKGAPLLSTDEILEIDYEYDSLEVN